MMKTKKRTMLGAALAGAMLLSLGAPAAMAQATSQPRQNAPAAVDKPAKKDKKAEAKAKVGEAAPAFTLVDLDGKTHNLADYKGKTVVLEWFNPECPYVKKHHELNKTMASLNDKFKEKDVVWLAVATGKTAAAADDLKAAKTDYGIAYPILLDTEGKVGREYGAKTTPHMYVIDKEGVLRYAGAIDNNNSPRTLGETNYVEEALTAVLAGETVPTAETKAYGCGVKY